jgi:hypothetical protein
MAQNGQRFVRAAEPRTLPPMSRARMHDPLPDPGEHAMDMDADLHSDGAAESQSTGNTNHYYLANPPLRGPASIRIRPGTYGQESASLSAASRSERGSSMRGREVGSQRSIIGGGGGGGGAEQGSCAPMGVIKVGEVLSKQYDLTTVDPEDRSSVLATIRCIVTLEERVPELDITVNREPGYYAILVRGFDEFIDIVNWHSKVRAAPGRGNKMRLVHNFLGDPGTGILVVRVGMRETGAVNCRRCPKEGPRRSHWHGGHCRPCFGRLRDCPAHPGLTASTLHHGRCGSSRCASSAHRALPCDHAGPCVAHAGSKSRAPRWIWILCHDVSRVHHQGGL